MSLTLPTTADPVTDGEPTTTAKRVPVAGGEPITTGGVTLAVCAREGEAEPMLCRLSVSTGAYRPTGRIIDFARALTAGLLVAPPAPAAPLPNAVTVAAPADGGKGKPAS